MNRVAHCAWFVAALIAGLGTTVAQSQTNGCLQATIMKPSPFMGNNDEIFVLSDGTVWQVKYEYEYLYEYYPKVIICPSSGKLIVKGKELTVVSLSGSESRANGHGVIQTQIDGEFTGWNGETIYKLRNGQIWQQAIYLYRYHYAYAPEVTIYPSGGEFKMHVDGDDGDDVAVKQIR